MLIILIPILIILAIILLILNKKDVIKLGLRGNVIITILLIFLLLFVCLKIFVKRHDIVFFFQSLEYINIDKYDYSKDITDNGYISKKGAIKIAKEKTNRKRVSKVKCELVENGTYFEDYGNTILNNKINVHSQEKQATYWLITLVTGWDKYMHEENWTFKIDYYTGKILEYSHPEYD